MSDLALKLIDEAFEKKSIFLDLGHCNINFIPEAIIKLKDTLEHLNLGSWHSIEAIENPSSNRGSPNIFHARGVFDILSALPKLKKLAVVNCYVTRNGAERISQLTSLISLDISSNQIEEKGAEHISKLSNLTMLYIGSNKIGEKGAEHISKLSRLTSLEIGYNKIGEKGAEHISRLTNLSALYIRANDVGKKGAEYISSMPRLRTLDISYNELEDKGAEYISSLSGLTSLNIGYNRIGKEGAKHIGSLSRLTSLDISSNQIGEKGAENISCLSNLTALQIGSNKLKEKGAECISRLSHLTSLNISDNNINDKGAEYISRLSNLTILNIGFNNIKDEGAEYISGLSGLTTLHTDSNEIKDKGAEAFGALTNLLMLDMTNNKVENIPFELVKNLNLNLDTENKYGTEKLLLAGNPILNPPTEVLKMGRTAILEYLEGTLKPLNECKLIFIGDGAAGKTSLMKRLVYGTFDKAEKTTHGINKVAWKKIENEKGEPVKVNLWDFGGQHIQHSLHQFFFTERVIYVLVLNPRHSEGASYWLDQVEKLGKDSKCLVVYNWKDEKDKEAPYLGNYQELRKTYPLAPEPLLLSCATGENMDVFENEVRAAVLQNEGLKTEYPVKWFEIKTRLEQGIPIERNFIEYPEYERWCEEKDYNDPDRRKNLLRILNSVGSIVFFDKPILTQFQVLNPEWITTGAYAVLTSERTKETKGHLKWGDLVEIFRTEKEIFADRNIRIRYTELQFQFILELMLEYKLCQRNPFKDHEYLIPSAFGGQPQKDYRRETEGGRQYRLQFESPFEMLIIHRFIAKNIVHLTGNDYWYSGIYFKHATSETHALVETNLYSKQINCWIKGENIRGLWEVIRNDFREIFKTYHNFAVKEEVLYTTEGRSVFLPYEEMLNCIRDGVITMAYHATYRLKNINVLQVLELFESREQTLENAQNLKVEVNPQIHVNPQFNVHPQLTASPAISVNPQITNTVHTEKEVEKEPDPQYPAHPGEEKQELKTWQREAIRIFIIGLAVTVLLVWIYNKEMLFSQATWNGLKEQDIFKWGGIVVAFIWNGFIGKIVYDRYYDPSKKKAFIDNLRQDSRK